MATRKRRTAKQETPKQTPKQEEPKQRRKQVKALDFVPVWQGASTAEQVSAEFGREPSWASAFASRLRGMGVELKKMKRRSRGGGGKKIDVDELNALANESFVEDEED